MAEDLREQIAKRPMTMIQVVTVLVCQVINILDGFDVVIVSYAAPLISDQWSLSPERLGIVFSAGLFGMTIGAFLLAPLADRIGRRKTVILGLCMVTAGMLATRWAGDVTQLVACRAFTGLGIGALFASLTTLVVEYSSEKRRTMSVSVLYLGYPIGATLGGLIAKYNIEAIGWQSFFLYGGVITGALIPIAIFVLPESIDFLLARQPKNALKQINRLTAKLGLKPIDQLPEASHTSSKENVGLLFSDTYRSQTIKLWVSFFMSLLVIYFLISWTPKVLTAAGLSLDRSILGGILLNVGGGIGMMTLGFLSSKFSLNRIIAIYFVFGAVFMAVFAGSGTSLNLLMLITTLIGFFTYGSLIGLYAFAAQRYPSSVRSTGVGWAIGVGRIGSIIGPYLAGQMIGWGWDRSSYYLVLAIPLIIGAVAVLSAQPAVKASTAVST